MQIEIKAPVAVLGFGIEGKAALEFLKTQKISDITICDENDPENLPGEMKSKLGPLAFTNLDHFKTIIRSPGVHYDIPGIIEAKKSGSAVTSLTDLTLEVARERVTAISGSNGKTSVVAMLEGILKNHYKEEVIIGGNDRNPVLKEALKNPQWPILMEVSSFQFADLHKSPHIAAVLNITPNHLDWHEDLEDYIHAKSNLIAHQTPNDWAILNANDENSNKLAEKAPSQIFWLGKEEGKAWAVWEGEDLVAQFGSEEIRVLSKSDLKCKTHPDNILCTVAVSLIHGVAPETIVSSLADFSGAEHRLEFVKEIDGVQYYNDSACTTPESAWVAIQQFPAEKLILLLGGSSKKADFSFLAHHIVESKTRVILYGEEADHIKDALETEGGQDLILGLDNSGSFTEIIAKAQAAATPNDNIVLSPACASFDMFKNSKDRGNKFKEIVMSL